MKISVAMATYNGEKYIEEQLQSILNQTRPVDEVVIVDDGSTDQTVAILHRFIESHNLSYWTCVVNDQNLGFRENFKKVVGLVSGDLVFLSDQDDIWVQDRVEVMAAMMEQHSEIGVLCTNYQTFKNSSDLNAYSKQKVSTSPQLIPLNSHTIYLRSLGCAMCFRHEFYVQVKDFWTENWAHDVFLWSVSLLFSKGYRSEYYSINHRIHAAQFSGHKNHSKSRRIMLLKRVYKNQFDLLRISRQISAPLKVQKMLCKTLLTTAMRLELLQDKKVSNLFPLLFHLKQYYSKKSYLAELTIAMRG